MISNQTGNKDSDNDINSMEVVSNMELVNVHEAVTNYKDHEFLKLCIKEASKTTAKNRLKSIKQSTKTGKCIKQFICIVL